jgi:hypothetical protein
VSVPYFLVDIPEIILVLDLRGFLKVGVGVAKIERIMVKIRKW